MSIMGSANKRASRRYKDVRVVLNGALAVEREALMQQIGQEPQRMGQKAPETALRAWEEEHKADVLTVRVNGASQVEWRQIQRKHPVAKDQRARDLFDGVKGFSVIPVTIEVLEKFGQVVSGEKVETPTDEEWSEFWENVSPGDMTQLALAVISVHEETAAQTYGDLVKA